MKDDSRGRPAAWRERQDSGGLVGWIEPSRSDALKDLAIGLVVAAVAAGIPLVFFTGRTPRAQEWLAPLVIGGLALVLVVRACQRFLPPTTVRIAQGSIAFTTRGMPFLPATTLPLREVVALRVVSRRIQGKMFQYELWDVQVETRDGTRRPMKLDWGSEDEATWLARRLSLEAGLPP